MKPKVALPEFAWGKVVCLLELKGFDGIASEISSQLEDIEGAQRDSP